LAEFACTLFPRSSYWYANVSTLPVQAPSEVGVPLVGRGPAAGGVVVTGPGFSVPPGTGSAGAFGLVPFDATVVEGLRCISGGTAAAAVVEGVSARVVGAGAAVVVVTVVVDSDGVSAWRAASTASS
jgi:hypothetical protein